MKLIALPAATDIILPFYLAVEEWAAANLPPEKYFFAWQVAPTVICGRHQDMGAEVDLDYASSHDIKVWRRKSGGGAVYADCNNVMFSYITPSTDVQTTFSDYTSMICSMLGALGLHAVSTGRNDIAINGHKVAGNAFLKLPGRSIVHGTMLYDADFESMSRVLTPSKAKRESKGVVSVPSRITTLRREGLSLSCDGFIRHATEFLCADGIVTPTDDDIRDIEHIMQTYIDPAHLRRNSHGGAGARYYDGLGQLKVNVTIDPHGCIADVELWGDFLPLKPVDKGLTDKLRGLPYQEATLRKALPAINTQATIAGLTDEILITAMFT